MVRPTRSRGRKVRKAPSSADGMRTLHEDLKDLKELQMTSAIRFLPEQKDVPRIRFSKDSLFNAELTYRVNISTSISAMTTGSLVFQLSNVSNYANYTAIFDRYRIIQADAKFVQNIQPGTAASLLTCIDYDDGNSPSGEASVEGFGTLAICPSGVVEQRTLNPRLAVAAYSGAFTSYANMPSSTWIDSASPSVNYFGLKYEVPVTATSYAISVYVTLMVQFKSQRAT